MQTIRNIARNIPYRNPKSFRPLPINHDPHLVIGKFQIRVNAYKRRDLSQASLDLIDETDQDLGIIAFQINRHARITTTALIASPFHGMPHTHISGHIFANIFRDLSPFHWSSNGYPQSTARIFVRHVPPRIIALSRHIQAQITVARSVVNAQGFIAVLFTPRLQKFLNLPHNILGFFWRKVTRQLQPHIQIVKRATAVAVCALQIIQGIHRRCRKCQRNQHRVPAVSQCPTQHALINSSRLHNNFGIGTHPTFAQSHRRQGNK